MSDRSNIVLVGMPGVGKSTVGVLLAKAAGLGFVDTDVLIQAGAGRTLQEIIDQDGIEAFCRIEEQYVLCLDVRRSVIATGGSVVYSAAAMAYLRASGRIVFLDLPLEALAKRISNMDVRGVVMAKGQTLASLYESRRGLYQQYAEVTVDCLNRNQDQVVAEILRRLGP